VLIYFNNNTELFSFKAVLTKKTPDRSNSRKEGNCTSFLEQKLKFAELAVALETQAY
jgi:hypothetical protein